MAARDLEAEPVEPRAHLGRGEAVQVEELDSLVADLRDAAQRFLEVLRALLAKRVEHEADLRHASAGFRPAMRSRYQ